MSRVVTVMFLVLTYGAVADGKGISHRLHECPHKYYSRHRGEKPC